MSDPSLFKRRHFEAGIILRAVRWYLGYALSDRDVEELMRERGVWVDHTTVFRWVQRDAPELDKQCQPYLRATKLLCNVAVLRGDTHSAAEFDAVVNGAFVGRNDCVAITVQRNPNQPQ